jgi:hypothetical protein
MAKFLSIGIIFWLSISTAWADNCAKILYSRLSPTEVSLSFYTVMGETLVGVSTHEKSIDGLLCRKSAGVVIKPVPSYVCLVRMDYTQAQFKSMYLGLKTAELRVAASDAKTGSPIVGDELMEKTGQDYVCQRRTAVVPNPVPSYTCWKNIAKVK